MGVEEAAAVGEAGPPVVVASSVWAPPGVEVPPDGPVRPIKEVSAATGASLFFATSDCDPRIGFELDIQVGNPDEAQARGRTDGRHPPLPHAVRPDEIHRERRRPSAPCPVFQPGDMVFLDTRNMRTISLSCKLDDKNAGPFRVLCTVGPHAYKLILPAEMELLFAY